MFQEHAHKQAWRFIGPGAPLRFPAMASPLLSSACVVLVRTQGPINLGMIARLCGNLGITDLRLVAPLCEVNCPESRKFSTHSRELMLHAPVFPTLELAVADCGLVIGSSARLRDHELGAGLTPQEVPGLLSQRPVSRFAVVFGNEADGLNDAELRCCQAWIHLETFGDNASYNLANACAITLYLIATATPRQPGEQPVAAVRSHVEDLFRYWHSTLARFQYFRRTDPLRFSPLLRKFIGRLHLSQHDVQVLRGMLAQFNYFTFGDRGEERPAAIDAQLAAPEQALAREQEPEQQELPAQPQAPAAAAGADADAVPGRTPA
jgi:TrmH family RNA methyltransferase